MDVGLEPGFGHDFHKHPEQDELITVLAGRIEQWIDKEKTILEAGDSVYLDKDVVHASFNVGDVPVRMFVVLAPSVGDEGYQLVDVSPKSPGRPCAASPHHRHAAPHRSSRLRRGRAREHARGVCGRHPPRRGRDRGGRAAPARRRAGGASRPRRRAGAPLLADVLALAAPSRRGPQSGPQGERHRTPAGRARARRRADRPGHVHGRQLGDARRDPPRGAGHPRRA